MSLIELVDIGGRRLQVDCRGSGTPVVVLRGLDGQDVSIERKSIQELRAAAASLMPDGLLVAHGNLRFSS